MKDLNAKLPSQLISTTFYLFDFDAKFRRTNVSIAPINPP